jgi:hypothetical protein
VIKKFITVKNVEGNKRGTCLSGLAAAALGAKIIGSAVLDEGTKEATKSALKQLLTKFDKENDPVIFFGLFCTFKELPSFDVASSQINTIWESTSLKAPEFVFDKYTFNSALSWDELEGCEIPDDDWELDTYATVQENPEDLDYSAASTCISGFTIWVYPVSQSNNKEGIIDSAYRVLAEIKRKLLDNRRLIIRKAEIFGFVRADESMCLRVEKKLTKKMREQKLDGNVYVETVPNQRHLLTVPLRERMYALAFGEAFKRWGLA